VLQVPVQWSPSMVSYLTPGRSAVILANGTPVGIAGELLARIVDERGAPRQDSVYVAELDLESLQAARERNQAATPSGETVRPLPRYPFVVRDLSIVVAEALSAESIRGTIQAAAAGAPAPLVSVNFFDRYKGKGVAEDAVSLSVRLTFQSTERTLTDADVQQSFDRIRDALVRQHGAVQR